MSEDDEIPSIDDAELENVPGGATTASSKAQVATALQGITSTLSSLRSSNTGSSSLQSMLPLLMLGRGGAGGACPCGCGMANCIRR